MWLYNKKEFTSEMIDDNMGFVYVITELETGKKYLGKKLFVSTRRLKPLKGKKRRRVVKKESDWQLYYGSNDAVKLLVEEKGSNAFKREIIKLCKTKGEMSYFEAKEQFDRDVLLTDEYYNGIISCRINHTHVNHLKR